jgi:uncharacterized protein YbjT (DUF2867 family)
MILVTGATGNVGRELVKQLLGRGQSLRVVSRDEKKVAHLNPLVERVIGDMNEESTVERAVEGVERIFMFPMITDEDHHSNVVLLEKSKKAGVKHVVMLSSMGASNEDSKIGAMHRDKEVLVEKSGIPWTFVRPGSFMSNTFQWQPMIKFQGKVFSPTGNGKVAPISPGDIAAVAAVALTDGNHEGKIYTLTGPELLDAHEQVAILSDAIGKPIECVDVPVSAAAEQMTKNGLPNFLIDGLSVMWDGIKRGEAAVQTKDLERLTGSKGESFKQWCSDHRTEFLN